jgi:hypothetical protein
MNPDQSDASSAPAPRPGDPASAKEPSGADAGDSQPGALTGAGAASALAHMINLERLKVPRPKSE